MTNRTRPAPIVESGAPEAAPRPGGAGACGPAPSLRRALSGAARGASEPVSG